MGKHRCSDVARLTQLIQSHFEESAVFCLNGKVKRKTTVYLEEDVLKSMRVAVARAGKHDYEAVEAALRSYLGLELLERVEARSPLGESEALEMAYEELHHTRS